MVAVALEMSVISLFVTPTSLIVNQNVSSFLVGLTSSGSGMPALSGKNILLDYGDPTTPDMNTTDLNGQATFQHTDSTAGFHQVQAAFAGEINLRLPRNVGIGRELCRDQSRQRASIQRHTFPWLCCYMV